ncbi:amidase [Rhodotorula toruloides]|uniref:amidase n=1 Tax=Rhodotorula toruloides TaxID=5286 RepID=A0A511KNW0_RHOTO|nr:amidase [Rhodotorula toruloides]
MLVKPAVHSLLPAQLPQDGISKVGKVSWAVEAAAKKAAQAALIPSSWKLPSTLLNNLPIDVRPVVTSCGLLTSKQLAITDIDEASVLLARIRNREYSAADVVEAFCLRAAIAHQLANCLTEILSDSALARAEQLDKHFQRTGEPVGPLHGLPISLKDQFDVANVDSTIGFTSLIGRPAHRNSVLVDILESLGAIVFCKTNVPQTLMAAETHNNIFGRTVNPSNRNLTSGGSSGGEAALLALKGSILGVGTDYGGSIRVPSHCCGLYGLRPTTRRLPYAGVTNVMKGYEGMESTIGPMARSIDSLEVFMAAVIGAEPWWQDAKTVERTWRVPHNELPKKLHIAFALDNGLIHSHPPIRRAISEMVAALAQAGHEVTPLEGIDWNEASELVGLVSGADGGEDLRSFLASGEPVIPEAFPFAVSTAITVYELSQLMQRRDAFRHSLATFKNAPLVVQLVNPRRFREDELLAMATVVGSAVRKYKGDEQ